MSFDEGAVRWLVSYLARNKPKDLVSFVNGRATTLADLAGKEGNDGPAYVSWIVESLFAEENVDLQRAGAKILLTVTPANRAAVAQAGALEGVRGLLVSNNEELLKIGLDVLEGYATDGAKQLAMASIEAMPNDALKLRAAKFAGIDWGNPQ